MKLWFIQSCVCVQEWFIILPNQLNRVHFGIWGCGLCLCSGIVYYRHHSQPGNGFHFGIWSCGSSFMFLCTGIVLLSISCPISNWVHFGLWSCGLFIYVFVFRKSSLLLISCPISNRVHFWIWSCGPFIDVFVFRNSLVSYPIRNWVHFLWLIHFCILVQEWFRWH